MVKEGTVKGKPGYESKPYRTNSHLLLQVVEEKDGTPKDVTELQTIIECVTKALKAAARAGDGICKLSFKPEGCLWKFEFDPSLGDANQTYKMQIICSASRGHNCTNYMVDTILVPKVAIDPDPLAAAPPALKVVKPVFETLALKIRKSLVALEFPVFPEGCKGRPFKDIYQLNARVSSNWCLSSTWQNAHGDIMYVALI